MYQRFCKLNISHAAIGLEQRGDLYPYFCTPKDAEVIGWAGVDGIHYCTVPAFGEIIFAVSPMNVGDYVHPIARSFRELLELLLTCGHMAALEQCYAWDEEQYKAFCLDCPITPEQQAVLDVLRETFDLEPAGDVLGCVKKLQREFDLSRIPYTEDYYDADMNPAAPMPTEWKVTYDGGFWSSQGKAGEKISVGKHFQWGEERWYIPAAYQCSKGLVVDFCKKVAPKLLLKYIEKWDLYNEEQNRYTPEQQEQMERENPLESGFSSVAVVNGREMHSSHGCSLAWIPEKLVPEEIRATPEARQLLEHYGLDPEYGWEILRCSYPWATARKPKLKELILKLERERERLPGIRFRSPKQEEEIVFQHPLTGVEHTLRVLEYEAKQLPEHAVWQDAMEYPRQYTLMSYSVTPDIPRLMVQDCKDSDQPRPKQKGLDGLTSEETAALALIGGESGPVSAASFGIIGGADGPTALIFGGTKQKLHAACSALRFEPAEDIEWKVTFCEKQMEDVTVEVLP